MKKQYSKPTTELIAAAAESLMQGSIIVDPETTVTPEMLAAPQRYDIIDEEEE